MELVFHTTSGALWSGPPSTYSTYLNVATWIKRHNLHQLGLLTMLLRMLLYSVLKHICWSPKYCRVKYKKTAKIKQKIMENLTAARVEECGCSSKNNDSLKNRTVFERSPPWHMSDPLPDTLFWHTFWHTIWKKKQIDNIIQNNTI